MKSSEIRSRFLNYFKNRHHQIVESSSLVPDNDPTLLFTNAGMVQFKDVFTGRESRDYTRACSSQKCVRAGGKHNDLENVGFTARHHTFFEMLGNFSFGDYFKEDAIRFAWDFVTNELKLPKNKLYVTVFNDDDEAASIWEKQEKVPKDHIFRFGEKDNFWSMGDTGPCGPCTEIFFDRGEKYGNGDPNETVGSEGDRFVEIWNLVFMQFEREVDGTLTPLPKPSVDTGAGLERLTAVLQNAESNYDTDVFLPIISSIEKMCAVKYDLNNAQHVSFRVIADHIRATTFLISDGVMPSNEGRGYVLRRIMRRAIRHGKKIGFSKPFMSKLSEFTIDNLKVAYPELVTQKEFISKTILTEEEQFLKTLERGLEILDEEIKKIGDQKKLSGSVAFKLYDTFGFPLDLTRVILNEKGLDVVESEFEAEMSKQREMSRRNWSGSGDAGLDKIYQELNEKIKTHKMVTEFIGYESTVQTGQCIGIISEGKNGKSIVERSTTDSDFLELAFDRTPFYGESGGQIGDRGKISGHGFQAEVLDVQKPIPNLTLARVGKIKGQIEVGKQYDQEVSEHSRKLVERNHTATHLLQWALRETLGAHVKQAGSLVTEELLRFDFTHFEAVTKADLEKIENLINDKIWSDFEVTKDVMSKDAAIEKGAIAFFGEKYGDTVRVVSVGDFSTELCGGCHVHRSGEISLFKIISENGIASGVRRIIAFTSENAFKYLRERDSNLKDLQLLVKATAPEEIPLKIAKFAENEKKLKKELDKLRSLSDGAEVDNLVKSSRDVSGTSVIVAECESDEAGIQKLRDLADRIRQKNKTSVIMLGMRAADHSKAFVLAAKGKDAPTIISANEIIKLVAPLIDGRGGGKPDLAQAGGKNVSGLKESLSKAFTFIEGKLK